MNIAVCPSAHVTSADPSHEKTVGGQLQAKAGEGFVVMVTGITPGGQAESAGVEEGDWIISVSDWVIPTTNPASGDCVDIDSVIRAVASFPRPLEIEFVRENDAMFGVPADPMMEEEGYTGKSLVDKVNQRFMASVGGERHDQTEWKGTFASGLLFDNLHTPASNLRMLGIDIDEPKPLALRESLQRRQRQQQQQVVVKQQRHRFGHKQMDQDQMDQPQQHRLLEQEMFAVSFDSGE
jgi:hypothetical protein